MWHSFMKRQICLCFPRGAGLSVALMESMAKGLPALVSRIRGNVDLIEEGRGGILVSAKDPDEFAGDQAPERGSRVLQENGSL